MTKTYILSCEHAGNEVPPAHQKLFKKEEEVLYTHKGIDFGALRLAQALAKASGLPLYYTTISRLLVEADRSPDNEELFSEWAQKLSRQERETVLNELYYPHRQRVENKIREQLDAGNQVVQLAVHTFTPVLEGEVREADIGLLFDPEQPLEQAYAQAFKQAILAHAPALKVFYNAPYPGTDDSLPTYLRKRFPKESYGGLELEVNQKFFLAGEKKEWKKIVKALTAAFLELIKKRG